MVVPRWPFYVEALPAQGVDVVARYFGIPVPPDVACCVSWNTTTAVRYVKIMKIWLSCLSDVSALGRIQNTVHIS